MQNEIIICMGRRNQIALAEAFVRLVSETFRHVKACVARYDSGADLSYVEVTLDDWVDSNGDYRLKNRLRDQMSWFAQGYLARASDSEIILSESVAESCVV